MERLKKRGISIQLIPRKIIFMIVALNATANEISESGRKFNWPEHSCEKCSRKMWGHGYVSRYFDGITDPIPIKRLICAGCGMVVIFRPSTHWARFRSSIKSIYEILCFRLKDCFWPPGFRRQRGGYWLTKLIAVVLMNGVTSTLEFLEDRYCRGICFFV